MKIVFAGNKERGTYCLDSLLSAGYKIPAVIAHPDPKNSGSPNPFAQYAKDCGLRTYQPEYVNDKDFLDIIRSYSPELIILAGYGQIVGEEFISIAPCGCINLHGGKLPAYRGSSPMNWALINGDSEITISIIQVDRGVDSGDILLERTIAVSENDTIADVQNHANKQFPGMLLEVINGIRNGTIDRKKQDSTLASYYPLRFPDDGLILWDQLTAYQIHNRIRALTDPFPGAYTFFRGKKVKLLKSSLLKNDYYGEPGRIYRITENSLLVCASDRCLLIEKIKFEDESDGKCDRIKKYEKFITVRDMIVSRI